MAEDSPDEAIGAIGGVALRSRDTRESKERVAREGGGGGTGDERSRPPLEQRQSEHAGVGGPDRLSRGLGAAELLVINAKSTLISVSERLGEPVCVFIDLSGTLITNVLMTLTRSSAGRSACEHFPTREPPRDQGECF